MVETGGRQAGKRVGNYFLQEPLISNPLRHDVRMIFNRIVKTGRILNHFGKAWLVQRANGNLPDNLYV
jgi:hypothetical protein